MTQNNLTSLRKRYKKIVEQLEEQKTQHAILADRLKEKKQQLKKLIGDKDPEKFLKRQNKILDEEQAKLGEMISEAESILAGDRKPPETGKRKTGRKTVSNKKKKRNKSGTGKGKK